MGYGCIGSSQAELFQGTRLLFSVNMIASFAAVMLRYTAYMAAAAASAALGARQLHARLIN